MKDRQLRKVLQECGLIFSDGTPRHLLSEHLAKYSPYNFVLMYEFRILEKKVQKIMELLDIEEVEESQGLKKGNKKVNY